MKFLTEFDKILPFVIGLFSKEELEVLAADESLGAAHVHSPYGVRVRNLLLSSHGGEILTLFGENGLAEIDHLVLWMLMFLCFFQRSQS